MKKSNFIMSNRNGIANLFQIALYNIFYDNKNTLKYMYKHIIQYISLLTFD